MDFQNAAILNPGMGRRKQKTFPFIDFIKGLWYHRSEFTDNDNEVKNMASKITFTIQEELGDLSSNSKGWKKQLTYMNWNNGKDKFDLRSWNEDHTAMTKGLTLTKEEMMKLRDILNGIDFDKY